MTVPSRLPCQGVDFAGSELDLPRLTLGRLMTAQSASAQPFENSLRGDVQCFRGTLYRVTTVRPPRRVRVGSVYPAWRNAPSLAQHMNSSAFERRAARRHSLIGIERIRDLPVHLSCGAQLAYTRLQLLRRGAFPVGLDFALHDMLACSAGLPGNTHPDLPRCALLVEDDLAHHKAQYLLAFDRRRLVPHALQILCQSQDLRALRGADRSRLFPTPSSIGLLDFFGCPQRHFPGPFERARHQAVFRLYRIVLPPCSL